MWPLVSRVLLLLACSTLPAGAVEDPAHALDLIKPNRQQQAKDFKIAALDGGRLNLADFKGKVVFLNLWATWCGPCKEEMPAMERLWQRYKGEGLVVIALSMDSGGAKIVKPYIEQAKYTYPIGLDPKMEIAQLYGAQGHSGYGTFQNVIRLMASRRIDLRPIITSRFPLSEGVEAIARASLRQDGKVMVKS